MPTEAAPQPRTWSIGMQLAALLLLALNLRFIFPSLSVLLPDIQAATGMSAATAGYLTTLPVLCLGVFAPLAPRLLRGFGMQRTLTTLLLLLAVGSAARALGVVGLFLGSLLAGASVAVANVLLPVLVKRDFPGQVALVTALYVTLMTGGSSFAAALTLPILHGMGADWHTGVAMWALPAVVVAALWWFRPARPSSPEAINTQAVQGLWHDRLAWSVMLFMGMQSALAYTVMGWLAPILQHRGMSPTTAGFITAICIVGNLVGSLFTPFVIKRLRDQQRLNIWLSVMSGLPLMAMLFVPLPLILPLAVIQGPAQGALFAAALTAIVYRARDSRVAAGLSSMAQAGGYTIAAGAPLLVGLILSWTGSFSLSAILFALITVCSAFSGAIAGRTQYVLEPQQH